MIIGIFSDVFYPYLLGGGETRYYEIARRLVELGDEVHVLTATLFGESKFEEPVKGLKIYRGGWPPHPLTHRSLLPIPSYMLWTFKMMHIIKKCEILDLNTYASALAGLKLAKKLKKPVVVTIHDVFASSWLNIYNPIYGFFGILSESLIAWLNKNGIFLTVSNATKQKMIRELGINEEKIFVVPNGVNFKAIRETVKFEERKNEEFKRVIYVGRLVKYKNIEHLLYLVKSLKRELNVFLDIVGSGNELERLKKLSKKLHIDKNVNFHGFIKDRSKVYKMIYKADALINPSYFEGFGMVLLEALAVGTPVIAYNLEAYKEFLINNVNCLLVKKGDLSALINATKNILLNDKLAERIKAEGLKTAIKFDWMNITLKVKEIYNKVYEQFT